MRTQLNIELGNAYWSSGDRASAHVAFHAAEDLARRAGAADLFTLAAIGRGGRRAWTDAGVSDSSLIAELEEALVLLPAEASGLRAMATARLADELYFIAGNPSAVASR